MSIRLTPVLLFPASLALFPPLSLLKDAFNPEEETERDWDIDLRDDIKTEVESKYGKVVEIFVVKESQVSLTLVQRRYHRSPLMLSVVDRAKFISSLILPPRRVRPSAD